MLKHVVMKKNLFAITLILLLPAVMLAQGNKDFNVVFYDVENLFDTIDHPDVRDEEFTPNSEKKWTSERYSTKLGNLSKVLSASTNDGLPEVIGLCEVENKGVVADLLTTGSLKKGKYQIVHEDSPDGRGIDVAFAYRKKALKVVSHESITVNLPGDDARPTRDILHVTTVIKKKDTVHFFVNHWPSRYGGAEKSQPKRIQAAEDLREVVDDILGKDRMAKIVIMGDFNDYPDNASVWETLKAREKVEPEDAMALVNLAFPMEENGQGSYNYRGDWGMLDQIIVSQGLMSEASKGLIADENSLRIVKEEWMLFTHPKYGDKRPNRTYGGDNYYGGYSDHLPVVADLTVR